MLIGKEFSSAPTAGLYFIHDQQNIVFFSEFTQALHKFFRSWDHTTFALNWLEHDCNCFVGD